MTNVNFEYELQSGQVLVCDAEISEGERPSEGDPGIDPIVDLGDIYLKGEDGILCKFDPDGHWVRVRYSDRPNAILKEAFKFTPLAEIIEDAAWNAWEAQK